MKLNLSVKTEIVDNAKKKKEFYKKQKGKCKFCQVTLGDKPDIYFLLKESLKYALTCEICMNARCLDKLTSDREGLIIMMPEISQSELISLARAIHYLKKHKNVIVDEIDSIKLIEEEFIERSEIANHYYAEGISDPVILIQLLLSLEEIDYKKREFALYGLRWLPDMRAYTKEEEFLTEEYKKYNPKNWGKLINSIVEKNKKQN